MGSAKRFLTPYQVVGGQSNISGDMSAATITSQTSNIAYLDDVGVQFNFPGTATGTFQVQCSADYAQDASGNVTNPGNWAPLVFTYWNGTAFVTSTTIPTSVGSPIYLDLSLLSAPWIRSVYTKVSGTGTLAAYVVAKGLA